MSADLERATYTYAIARPFHPSHLWGVRGVDGTAVHVVSDDALVAVVGTLPFTGADEVALRTKLEDPAELEAIARAHHAVVETVFERSVTLPFRLATIHDSEQRVVEMLRAGRQRFDQALALLAGRVEIGVKIYADLVSSSPTSGRGGGAVEDEGSADPGRDYLRRRREQLLDRASANRRIADAAARTGDTLARLAVDHRYHRAQDPRLSGVTEENVLNAAYLVDVTSIESFVALARSLDIDLAETRVEITGPWPPYSFAEPDAPQGAAETIGR
jgi:hypothetical protein